MFLVLLYNYSAGLTLYWTTQNLLTIAQMKLTRSADKKPVSAPLPVNPAPKKKK
jgi:membrane protein insertase Oxa1/YidC/SpoIIIJ